MMKHIVNKSDEDIRAMGYDPERVRKICEYELFCDAREALSFLNLPVRFEKLLDMTEGGQYNWPNPEDQEVGASINSRTIPVGSECKLEARSASYLHPVVMGVGKYAEQRYNSVRAIFAWLAYSGENVSSILKVIELIVTRMSRSFHLDYPELDQDTLERRRTQYVKDMMNLLGFIMVGMFEI